MRRFLHAMAVKLITAVDYYGMNAETKRLLRYILRDEIVRRICEFCRP